MVNLEDLRRQRAALDNRIKEAEDRESLLNDESAEALADALHELMCKENHTDGCGYYYEKGFTPGTTHFRWLEAAQSLKKSFYKHTVKQIYDGFVAAKKAGLH